MCGADTVATPSGAVSSRERPRHIKEETSIRMTTDRNDFPLVRFSTDYLPKKDRTAIWRERFGPSVFKVEIEPPPPNTPVKVDMAARSLPGLQLLSGLYSPGS